MRATMRPILLALAAAAMSASDAHITGIWRLTGTIADVAIDRVCTIEQTGGKIQGPCKNQAGETVLSGEVNGDSISWKYEAKYDGATVVLVFKGTLESDLTMKGTITASDTAGNNTTTGTFTAKRQ
jgi:hypothetical protein